MAYRKTTGLTVVASPHEEPQAPTFENILKNAHKALQSKSPSKEAYVTANENLQNANIIPVGNGTYFVATKKDVLYIIKEIDEVIEKLKNPYTGPKNQAKLVKKLTDALNNSSIDIETKEEIVKGLTDLLNDPSIGTELKEIIVKHLTDALNKPSISTELKDIIKKHIKKYEEAKRQEALNRVASVYKTAKLRKNGGRRNRTKKNRKSRKNHK